MNKNILLDYTTKVRIKMMVNKKKSFDEFIKREDFE